VPLSLSFGTIVVSLVARVVKVCMVSSNKPPQLWMGVISAMVAAFLHTCLSPDREARIVQKSSFDTWRDGATRARKNLVLCLFCADCISMDWMDQIFQSFDMRVQ
jgi:hypothetical protein